MKITHSAGMFSCHTVALLEILDYFNTHRELPEKVDRREQYGLLKSHKGQNLIREYFKEEEAEIKYNTSINIGGCMSVQFRDYSKLPFEKIKPFVKRYFLPSDAITKNVFQFMIKYDLVYSNTVSVFYRGNDKGKEMSVAPYEVFINKAKEVKKRRPEVRFILQPDETEFMEAFCNEFPDTVVFEETPHMSRNVNTAIFYQLPLPLRPEHGFNFFTAVLCHAQCSEIISHSGNISLWLALYRGNTKGFHQVFKNKWYE